MEKGILTASVESLLASKLDEVVKLKGFWEAVDGVAFKIVITTIDNNLADKIPEEYKLQIRELLTDILEEKDYALACDKAADIIDDLIVFSNVAEATERLIFTGIFTAVAGLLAKIGTDEG